MMDSFTFSLSKISWGDLQRAGVPTAGRQVTMILESIASGDYTRLEELSNKMEELESRIGPATKAGRQAMSDFSVAYREAGRAARAVPVASLCLKQSCEDPTPSECWKKLARKGRYRNGFGIVDCVTFSA